MNNFRVLWVHKHCAERDLLKSYCTPDFPLLSPGDLFVKHLLNPRDGLMSSCRLELDGGCAALQREVHWNVVINCHCTACCAVLCKSC